MATFTVYSHTSKAQVVRQEGETQEAFLARVGTMTNVSLNLWADDETDGQLEAKATDKVDIHLPDNALKRSKTFIQGDRVKSSRVSWSNDMSKMRL